MDTDPQKPPTTETAALGSRFIRGFIGLVLVTAGATAIVGLVEQNTRDRIATNQSARAMQIVAEVLPPGNYDNDPHQDSLLISDSALLGSDEPLPAYRARFNLAPAAVALTVVAPDGYVAPIRLLVGIASEGTVTAVRALDHLETPGLGDQIDISKSDWIEQFAGRNLSSGNKLLALRRDGGDLDHISGATITSRAVSKAVRNALRYYAKNREQLFVPDAASPMPSREP